MPGLSYLVDTNILLRLVQPDSPEYGTIRQCTDHLWERGADLFYTSQNLAEFWNVCTRPANRNGFGFSVADADAATLASLTSTCRRLQINPQLYLTQLLFKLPNTQGSQFAAWLPDQWKLNQSGTRGTDEVTANRRYGGYFICPGNASGSC